VAHDRWGVTDGYEDASGAWCATAPESRAAVLAAMGVDPSVEEITTQPAIRVIRPGASTAIDGPAELRLEDGTVLRVVDALPPDIPLGYHELRSLDGASATRLIVSPGRCHLPPDLKTWGWAVQLYAARSRESWGFGDLADLQRLGRWSARTLGAGLLLLNPLHAVAPTIPQQPSPYYPISRRFLNPLYLRVQEVPGAAAAGLDLEGLAAAGRALNLERRIDRDAVFAVKMKALELIWGRRSWAVELEQYRAERGPSLDRFAVFCALAERHGAGWEGWPAEYRRPDAPAIGRFAADSVGRVDFHAWLQWLLDRQLATASAEIALMHDLPIGVDPGGADAWEWQDILTTGASVGAPPDRYIRRGQDWGLPPFIPHRLRATGYRPFVETIRSALRHARGLRVDHVMGLFRLWWVPRGGTAADGAFVRYPADDLLAILALESHRAGAVVVGEDLGTVEAGVRERLAEHQVLCYRLLWFEPDPPERYPKLALAAVTTHDLPTVAGLWSRDDIAAQRQAGLDPNVEGFALIRKRLAQLAGLSESSTPTDVIERTYGALAGAPSVLLTATLEDALGVVERPNMPSTVDQWPNWSLALPRPLEDLEQAELPRAIATRLHRS